MSSASKTARVVPLQKSDLSAEKLTKIKTVPRQIRTRRKRWLEKNAAYFETASAEVELQAQILVNDASKLLIRNDGSDPLTYDRLVHQHQTTAEREAEGRRRGWANTLETSLLRSEAKLAKVDPNNPKYQEAMYTGGWASTSRPAQRKGPDIDWSVEESEPEIDATPDTNAVEDTEGNSPVIQDTSSPTDSRSRQIGQDQWHQHLVQRFVDGYDNNFDYEKVDNDESLDAEWVDQQDQDAWFSDEEAALDSKDGETGVQDY